MQAIAVLPITAPIPITTTVIEIADHKAGDHDGATVYTATAVGTAVITWAAPLTSVGGRRRAQRGTSDKRNRKKSFHGEPLKHADTRPIGTNHENAH